MGKEDTLNENTSNREETLSFESFVIPFKLILIAFCVCLSISKLRYWIENLKNLKNIEQKNPVCILIGPEGDFSENERQSLVDNKKVLSISLGRNILRAETAAIAATSILSYQLSFTGIK